MVVRVGTSDFDVSAEMAQLAGSDTNIGAIACFVGKVRGQVDGAALLDMTLEHYPGMTDAELQRIDNDARQRFALTGSLIVHRVGTLRPGDNIVLVLAASLHRESAFKAVEFLMDYLKTRAPFWKKERLVSGETNWVASSENDEERAKNWQRDKS